MNTVIKAGNKTVIKSKTVHPILCPIYAVTCVLSIIFIIFEIFWLKHYSKAFQHSCFCCYFLYYFLYKNKDEIAVSDDFISTHCAKANDKYQDVSISTREIKKITFTDNQILTFYDDTDIISDFNLEKYTDGNIQLLLDELGKKIPVTTDYSCRFVIQHNIPENAKSQRRRIVKPARANKRKFDLKTSAISDNNKKERRRTAKGATTVVSKQSINDNDMPSNQKTGRRLEL